MHLTSWSTLLFESLMLHFYCIHVEQESTASTDEKLQLDDVLVLTSLMLGWGKDSALG